MSRWLAVFRCDYCGEELEVGGTEDGGFYARGYHSCFGESPGFVAHQDEQGVRVTHDSVHLELEVESL